MQGAVDRLALPAPRLYVFAVTIREGAMSASYNIDPVHRFVYTKLGGHVSDADLVEHQRALLADPRFDSSFCELVDLRDVTEVSVKSRMVKESAMWPLHAIKARRAIVAPSDVLFGLSRMYQLYRGEVGEAHLGVFRTLEPALEWLGIDPQSALGATIASPPSNST
jgi:hypothetical protein